MTKDVFVSHASEDKLEVADKLVDELNNIRITTWYDKQSLHIGDSLREKIDEGLAQARYGVVILSPAFFAKQWPKEELDGMFSRRTSDGQFGILPVWHNVTRDDVAAYSPMLAGKVGISTSIGLNAVASEIHRVVAPLPTSGDREDYALKHDRETIRLTDLPLAYGWIENRYFANCHLVGPAVIAPTHDILFSGCGFPSVEVFFPIQADRVYHGFLGVRNCAFVDCVFEGSVGMAVIERYYADIAAGRNVHVE